MSSDTVTTKLFILIVIYKDVIRTVITKDKILNFNTSLAKLFLLFCLVLVIFDMFIYVLLPILIVLIVLTSFLYIDMIRQKLKI